jgi:(p)ppGpp synthase/HD superfamily hydrolase
MTSTIWSQDTYIRTFEFASHVHQGQTIPGKEIPYIRHLSLVTMEVIASFRSQPECDQELAMQCAILHDTIEDTDVTYEQLLSVFDQRVADGVAALTKDKTLERTEQMSDSLQRILQQPPEVAMVKMADRISNLLPPPHYWTVEKCSFYHKEAITIHDTLQHASQPLAQRLQEKIEGYVQYTTP